MATIEAPITDQLRSEIEKEVRAIYEAKFTKEIADELQKLREQNEKAIHIAVDEFKKEQQPPSEEDIRKLLTQEYMEFSVEVPWDSPPADNEYTLEGEKKVRTFTIRELPQSKEKAFFRKLKEQIIPRASEIGALSFELLEGDVAKKITSAIETFEPAFDLMADACVMILDPKSKEKLTREWVQDNLSSYRIWNVIFAQMQVNRLRDFFSQLSRGSGTMKTNLGANIPSLLR